MRIVPTKDDIDDYDRMTKDDGDEDEGGDDGDTDEDDIDDDDDGISARATSHEGETMRDSFRAPTADARGTKGQR